MGQIRLDGTATPSMSGQALVDFALAPYQALSSWAGEGLLSLSLGAAEKAAVDIGWYSGWLSCNLYVTLWLSDAHTQRHTHTCMVTSGLA